MFVAPLMKQRTTHDCHMLCGIPVLWLVVATHVWAPQLLDQDPDDADEKDKVHLWEKKRKEMGGGFFSLFAHKRFSHPHRCRELFSSNKDGMWLLREEEDGKHGVHVSFLHKTQMVPILFSFVLAHFHTDGQNPAAAQTRISKLSLIPTLMLKNCHYYDSKGAAVSATELHWTAVSFNESEQKIHEKLIHQSIISMNVLSP